MKTPIKISHLKISTEEERPISDKLRIMHFGDTHLGRKQPSRIAEKRVESTLQAFNFLIEKAVDEDVDLVIHAGDVFDTVYPWHTVIEETREILKKLEEAEIPIYMIRGNHDRSYGRGRELKGLAIEHLENDYVNLVDPEPEEFGEPALQVGGVSIYCLGYYSSKTKEILEGFQPEGETSILVMHDFVEGITRTYSGENVEAGKLASKDLDYVAIGHDHQPNTWEEVNGTVFSATGGTVDYDFNSTEFGKHYNIIEAGPEGVELEKTGEIPQTLELRKIRVPVEEARVQPTVERVKQLEGDQVAVKIMVKGETEKEPGEIPVQEIEAQVEELENVEMTEVVLDLKVKGYTDTDLVEAFNVNDFLEEELEDNSEEFKKLHRKTSSMLADDENLTSSGINLRKEAREKLREEVEKEIFGEDK
ncbi:MAG: exonuclease SbcCD subunit D [Candidatus Nanohaloarchaea archaeon]